MKHLPYQTYKNSGIQWIDKVPSSWEISKIKWHCRVYSGDDSPSIDGEYPLIGANGIIGSSDTYSLEDNAVLMGRVGSAGLINYITSKSGVSDNALIFSNFPSVDTRYLYYFLLSDNFELDISKTAQPLITASRVKEHFLCIPSLVEQRAIVNFLDRETAKIDELIQKQEELIELIREKITSVTDSFVTRGLDKSTPLKKTKFQTLGEVPSHWDVLQIKKIVSTPITDGPHQTPDFLDEGVPFVSAEAVSKGFIDFEKIRGFISPKANEIYSRKYSPQVHDIYMVKSGATTGVTAIVEDRTDFNIWSPLAVIRCSKRMNPYYVLYAMRSKYFQEMVSLSWSFGTQQNIGMGVIENLYIPVPPKEEQDAIVFSISSILSSLKQLQDKAISAIPLFKEHRSSLISATVTGKIDVRKLV